MVKSITKLSLSTCYLVLTLTGSIWGQAIIQADILGVYSSAELTALSGIVANNGVTGYRVLYLTEGSDGLPDTASGFVALPDQPATKGIIAYQHGTVPDRQSVPSNQSSEADLALIFASQGYITTAADYLGLGNSRGFHPYVHAKTEASAGIDLLIAGRDLAVQNGIDSIPNIFVCGYSQGGHAAMAMAQALQERPTDDLWITAAAPMSGPYAISTVMSREILVDTVEYFFPAYLAYTMLSYQLMYQNLYSTLEEAFKADFVEDIRAFSMETISVTELNSRMISTLRAATGKSIPKDVFREDFVNSVLADSLHPVNVALADNDTYRWVPAFPMRLYYCMADDQVDFRNSVVAAEYMNSQGATDVQAIDLISSADHGQCVLPALLATLNFFNELAAGTSAIYEESTQIVQIMPNPTQDVIRLEGLKGDFANYNIYNHFGQAVKQGNSISGKEIDVNDLPAGLYHLAIISGGQLFSGSFIIHE
ncbi:MAG: T9SS type A sorting domain-containing protein [Saprospiraceae bacterium]|nr:T9SS type A sorting domain-containing protein [Saprospiraceae bacterium]